MHSCYCFAVKACGCDIGICNMGTFLYIGISFSGNNFYAVISISAFYLILAQYQEMKELDVDVSPPACLMNLNKSNGSTQTQHDNSISIQIQLCSTILYIHEITQNPMMKILAIPAYGQGSTLRKLSRK